MGKILLILICISILFFISEIFGRRKHIGRWWAFLLLLCGFIPGLIALIVSPSAKKKPTPRGKGFLFAGCLFLFFGGLNLIILNPILIPFFIIGFYLIQLYRGQIINGNPKFYFEKTLNKGIWRKEAVNDRKKIFYYGILPCIILLLIFSFKNTSIGASYLHSYSNFFPNLAEEKTSESLNNSISIKEYNRKFVYVVVEAKFPELDVFVIESYIDKYNRYHPADYSCFIEWSYKTYLTEIDQIPNYTEDTKYRILDKSEKQIDYYLSTADIHYRIALRDECKSQDIREELQDAKSVITESKIFTFDNYAEASRHRRSNSGVNL